MKKINLTDFALSGDVFDVQTVRNFAFELLDQNGGDTDLTRIQLAGVIADYWDLCQMRRFVSRIANEAARNGGMVMLDVYHEPMYSEDVDALLVNAALSAIAYNYGYHEAESYAGLYKNIC